RVRRRNGRRQRAVAALSWRPRQRSRRRNGNRFEWRGQRKPPNPLESSPPDLSLPPQPPPIPPSLHPLARLRRHPEPERQTRTRPRSLLQKHARENFHHRLRRKPLDPPTPAPCPRPRLEPHQRPCQILRGSELEPPIVDQRQVMAVAPA